MTKFIDPAYLNTPLYSDVYAFLTQQERPAGAKARVFETTIDRCPVSFSAVNWASNRGLYQSTALTPQRRFLIHVTEAGEEFIKEYEDYLTSIARK